MPAFSNKEENPYNWILYTHIASSVDSIEEYSSWKIIKNRYDIFHIHWPERFLNNQNFLKAFLRSIHFLFISFVSKIKGIKIIWTAHNLKSHENYYPFFEEIFWKLFIPIIDAYISLSEKADLMVKERFKKLKEKKGFVIPIGHYRNIYPNLIGKESARKKLGIPLERKVILYFGLIRSYKNLLSLINSFKLIEDYRISLLIVGKPFNDKIKKDIEISSSGDSRIKTFLRFVPESEVEIYMKSSDLMVLPQNEVFNSSSIILALSFNIPVLIPERFTGLELKKKFGEKWVKTFSELTPDILKESLEWAQQEREEWEVPSDMKWENIAEKTIQAYKIITGLK
ncbi:MAG: glycosyltransferase [Candidatus Aminicenantia bacterium]